MVVHCVYFDNLTVRFTVHNMVGPPLILISPSIEEHGIEFDDLSVSLSLKYESAVLQSGGIPVMVPITANPAVLAECVRRADGVILTGGEDINPDLYNNQLPPSIHKTIVMPVEGRRRDLSELLLIDQTFRQRRPLLAICRGHQLLNIAFGGSLIADIRRQVPGALNHNRWQRAGNLVHELTLTTGSMLAKIVGAQTLGVNSSHHKAVLQPAEPLAAVARRHDGIVEAMELKPEASKRMPFLLSVQFHPERLSERYAEHRAIFRRFVEACRRKRKT